MRVRVAPSPTGLFHIGTARTALFNYLLAKHYGGAFLLRIEDTDKERSEKKYVDNIIDGLSWLSIAHDETIVYQSLRKNFHEQLLVRLVEEGKAYISEEQAKDGSGRIVFPVRLKVTDSEVVWNDRIHGDIVTPVKELGDFVIARSIKDPLYHFAVVADDADMHITHIVRGDDHIANTARQILIQQALGYARPQYAHIPLIHNSDGGKMSKRKNAIAVTDFRDVVGIEQEALINFIVFMGWNPKNDSQDEIMDMNTLIKLFSFEGLQKAKAIWNEKKLHWFNREWRRKKSIDNTYRESICKCIKDTLEKRNFLIDEKIISGICNDSLERHHTRQELESAINDGVYDYLAPTALDQYADTLLFNKNTLKKETTHNILVHIQKIFSSSPTLVTLQNEITELAKIHGAMQVYWPLRVALTGKEKSMDPMSVAEILPADIIQVRLSQAILLCK